jgi:hypothetical protein
MVYVCVCVLGNAAGTGPAQLLFELVSGQPSSYPPFWLRILVVMRGEPSASLGCTGTRCKDVVVHVVVWCSPGALGRLCSCKHRTTRPVLL